ncbi:MAG TPA: superoxide dismutase [Cu-Zn] SodC [Alphaproteobacteria bacterium]
MRRALAVVPMLLLPGVVHAADITAPMFKIGDGGMGEKIGTVRLFDGDGGLNVRTRFTGLPPGDHGFHVHETADCGSKAKDGRIGAGLAAGGHYDPHGAGKHEGPKGHGHAGDLPLLKVAADGSAKTTLKAERLKVADLRGRALMIHAGGDNYADQPQPLGGGGARIACGAIGK